MNAPKSMKSTFAALAANRKEKAKAACDWEVYLLKKNGQRYTKPSASCITEKAAFIRKEQLENMNPGNVYIVCEVAK